MHINKLKIKNFKKYSASVLEFNDDLNIIVGDNESGKSTILEAIELCLNCQYRGKPLSTALTTDLFSKVSIETYLASDKAEDKLPEILIEAYLDGDGELKGDNNSLGEDSAGIFLKILFDPDLSDPYGQFINDPDKIKTLPIEYYKIEWFSFAWKRLTQHTKKVGCFFIDPPRLHPTFGTKKYIAEILKATLDNETKSSLNLNYRQLKHQFDENESVVQVNNDLDSDNEVTDKALAISVDMASHTSWENNLQLNIEEVPFSHIGKGEQNTVQIKLALSQKAKDTDIVLIEEPENHLSHMNLVKLIKYVEDKKAGQQVFITTHSSYVLNKLSFDKVCLLADDYKRLNTIAPKTIKILKRLPGYDTLRAVLASKVILVEGPSDELLLKKIYQNIHNKLPEEDGIDLIVVRGLGFKNYLEIIKHIGISTHVVRDNDGDYQKNITDWGSDYEDYGFINIFSPTDILESSLEPSLIIQNSASEDALNTFAAIALSTQTNTLFLQETTLQAKQEFLRTWYKDKGAKKVDSAIRIFESDENIVFPTYLTEAFNFG